MTNKINDGGPAFPFLPPGIDTYSGMSLRDYFAGQALIGVLSNHCLLEASKAEKSPALYLATACYGAADAMLKAREDV